MKRQKLRWWMFQRMRGGLKSYLNMNPLWSCHNIPYIKSEIAELWGLFSETQLRTYPVFCFHCISQIGNLIFFSLAVQSFLTLVVAVTWEHSTQLRVLAGSCGRFVRCMKGAWTSKWASSGIIDFGEQEMQDKCIYSSQESFGSTNGWIYLCEKMSCMLDIMHFKSWLQWDGNCRIDISILSVTLASSAFSFSFFFNIFFFYFKEPSEVLRTNTVLFF